MNFVLILEAAQNQLGVTQQHLAQIAQACTVQLNRDVAPFWGGTHLVRVGASVTDVQPGEVVVAYVDKLPNAPGDVAYHSVDGTGAPTIFGAVSMCNSILLGNNSLAQATSHELCETCGDPAIDLWADDGTGTEWARELCDAVESASYSQNGVALSDFVLPSFFDRFSVGPRFSFVGTATGPFRTAPGGYQVKRTAGGVSQQVNGDQRLTAEKRLHWSARSFKRGLRALVEAQ